MAGPGEPRRRALGLFPGPGRGCWHRLEWEHAAGLGTPFSAEAARYARRLAARQDRWPDTGQALAELLARWDQGMVTGRRERRMAARLAAERAALPDPADLPAEAAAACRNTARTQPQPRSGCAPSRSAGDDDDAEEIFDEPGDGDFYADAFEILE